MKPPVSTAPWGSCLASDSLNCPVHSSILPRTHWAFFSSTEDVDALIENLNDRGFRESELKEKLIFERDKIARNLKRMNFNVSQRLSADAKEEGDEKETEAKSSITSILDLQLRDQIMELEEKIYHGTLGTLKIQDRTAWQSAIQAGGFDKQCETLTWGGRAEGETPFASRLPSEKPSRDNVS